MLFKGCHAHWWGDLTPKLLWACMWLQRPPQTRSLSQWLLSLPLSGTRNAAGAQSIGFCNVFRSEPEVFCLVALAEIREQYGLLTGRRRRRHGSDIVKQQTRIPRSCSSLWEYVL